MADLGQPWCHNGATPLLILFPMLSVGDPQEGKGYVAIAQFWVPEKQG